MLINFYMSYIKTGCSKFIHFQTPREAFDPINGKCLFSNQHKKCYGFTCKKCSAETSFDIDKVYIYQKLKFINDVNT